jgi:hypothetical protein
MFMNLRGIEEYETQFLIDRNSCADISKTIQGIINTIMPQSF